MNSLFKLLSATTLGSMEPVEDRTVARNEVSGFTISTVYTPDQGYETAIGDTNRNFHPVERYQTKEEAAAGHLKWVEFITSGKRNITELGYDDIVDPENLTLS